jgi:glycogen synthase
MKVLHVLDHSLPLQSGYAFRSASILEAQRRLGIELAVLTSPKHDTDRDDEVDGVLYRRSWRKPIGDGLAGQVQCIAGTRAALRPLVAGFRPDVVHAHSPCLNGLAALGLGVPVVYEIRSSWEDAAVSSGKTREGSARYRLSAALETFVARRADAVVVLCQGLLDEFARRGLAPEKLTIVGNAINRDGFRSPEPSGMAVLRERHGLDGRRVLGFFGSYFRWEGLDTLIRALPELLARDPRIVVLLAGGGEEASRLEALARELGVAGSVRFAGRVDHDDMPDYYGVADMMVFPRRAIRIAEMVTPLKPLEAMHFGCLVAASDVGGHRELIEHGRTGILFPPDDPSALARAVLDGLNDQTPARAMRESASAYLASERTWGRMAERYLGVYDRARAARGERR